MNFGENLKYYRKLRNLTQKELGSKINISGSAIGMYEIGTREPNFEIIEALADVLNVDLINLIGSESELFNNKSTSSVVFDNIVPLSELPKKRVPILGSIACGKPIYAEEQHGEYIETDINADFALTCKGDSMIGARINDGDLVFIRKQNMVDNGSIAAVIINDEATLKRVFYYPEKEKLILQAENSKYEPLIYAGSELEEIKILGRAVAFQSLL